MYSQFSKTFTDLLLYEPCSVRRGLNVFAKSIDPRQPAHSVSLAIQIWHCRLQTFSVWRSLKFVVWERFTSHYARTSFIFSLNTEHTEQNNNIIIDDNNNKEHSLFDKNFNKRPFIWQKLEQKTVYLTKTLTNDGLFDKYFNTRPFV